MRNHRASPRPIGFLLILLLAVAAAYSLCGERFITGVDPANYLLGMRSYSIAQERPHPPGYPVFIVLARAASFVTGSDHGGIRLVVTLFALAAVTTLYLLARGWIGERGGRIAALLLAVNPLFWYYGSTSENYAFDAAIGPVLALLLLRTRGRWWIGAGIVIGLALGVRGTSVILLAPMALLMLRDRYRRAELGLAEIGMLAGGALVGMAAWLPAVAINEGSLGGALAGLTSKSAGTFAGNLIGLVVTFFWMANLSALYWVTRSRRILRAIGSARRSSRAAAVLLWIGVPVIFFASVIHTKGYLLLVLPALTLGTAWLIAGERGRNVSIVAGLLLTAHAAIFLLVPYASPPAYLALAPRLRSAKERAGSVVGRTFSVYLPSLGVLRMRDREVGEVVESVRAAVADGADTTLVVIDPAAATFAHPRILQYYLPAIRFAMPGVRNDLLMTFHQGMMKWRLYGDTVHLAAPRLLLVTDRGLVDRYPFMRAISHSGSAIAMLEGNTAVGDTLRRVMEDLFVRWDQEGEKRGWIVRRSWRSGVPGYGGGDGAKGDWRRDR